jgi:hypothetical protein
LEAKSEYRTEFRFRSEVFRERTTHEAFLGVPSILPARVGALGTQPLIISRVVAQI